MIGANASPVCVIRAAPNRVYGEEASSSPVFVTAASGSTAYVTGAFLSPTIVAGAIWDSCERDRACTKPVFVTPTFASPVIMRAATETPMSVHDNSICERW